MRELNECKAEIFRRSEKRIAQGKKRRNRIIALCVPLCILVSLWSVFILPAMMPAGSDMVENEEEIPDFDGADISNKGDFSSVGNDSLGSFESFNFSLTWNNYGISSYNSETGELVKTKDATNPGEYITEYYLTKLQKQEIFNLISDLDITSYPDYYNPNENLKTSPTMTLILYVKTDKIQKTVTAEDIAFSYEAENLKGQNFLSVCEKIINILIETEEWKSLPEYEFFYD